MEKTSVLPVLSPGIYRRVPTPTKKKELRRKGELREAHGSGKGKITRI